MVNVVNASAGSGAADLFDFSDDEGRSGSHGELTSGSGVEAVGIELPIASDDYPIAFGHFDVDGSVRAVEHEAYLAPLVAVGVVFDGVRDEVRLRCLVKDDVAGDIVG